MPTAGPASSSSTQPAAASVAFDDAYRRAIAHSADARTTWAALRAAAAACSEELATRWLETQAQDRSVDAPRRVHYMSMEFLMGRALGNALAALDLNAAMRDALGSAGPVAGRRARVRGRAGLGNGGLGRLAACFLDCLRDARAAVVRLRRALRVRHVRADDRRAGRQIEQPDHWLRLGNPWEIARPELRYLVGFGGRVEAAARARRWIPAERVIALAYDFIVPGHGTRARVDAAAVERQRRGRHRLRHLLPRRAPGRWRTTAWRPTC